MAEGAQQVTGVREVSRILKQVDRKVQRQTQAMMRQAASPMVAQARSFVPPTEPLSGWAHNGRVGWQQSQVLSGVKAATGGRAIRQNQTWPLLTLTQRNAAGMIYEWAGRSNYAGRIPRTRPYNNRPRGHAVNGQGFVMIANLPPLGSIKGSKYSRTLFPAFAATRDEVVGALLDALDQVARQVNVEIERV
jgi:hypothetical protein